LSVYWPGPGEVSSVAGVPEKCVSQKLRSAAALLEEVVAELEPGTFDVAGAKRLVDVFTRCERLAVAGRGLAARRVERAVSWKRSGHRSGRTGWRRRRA
jgi:hypothetical protein